MRLEDLFTNFGRSSIEDQTKFIAEYRLRRAKDLDSIQSGVKPKTNSSKTTSKVELSAEEKALMKMLGIKQKDVAALRALSQIAEPESDIDSTGEIFKDDSFEEEEDG